MWIYLPDSNTNCRPFSFQPLLQRSKRSPFGKDSLPITGFAIPSFMYGLRMNTLASMFVAYHNLYPRSSTGGAILPIQSVSDRSMTFSLYLPNYQKKHANNHSIHSNCFHCRKGRLPFAGLPAYRVFNPLWYTGTRANTKREPCSGRIW